jgi:hypothetical protein
MKWWLLGTIGCILAVLLFLSGREPTPREEPTPRDWNIVPGIRDVEILRLVVVRRGRETSRAVYDDAAKVLCEQTSSPIPCFVLFFAEGDRIPAIEGGRLPRGLVGTKDYPTLAAYVRNRSTGYATFTQWDCERAGIENSPPSTLCPGVREPFDAALKLGTYVGFSAGCGWPQTDDAAHFKAYLATVENRERRDVYLEGFETMAAHSPANRDLCITLRSKVDNDARLARQTFGISEPTPPLSQPKGRR